MRERDWAIIESALAELPKQCRYHGDDIEGTGFRSWDACCDTGRPALARRKAEAALKRMREAQ